MYCNYQDENFPNLISKLKDFLLQYKSSQSLDDKDIQFTDFLITILSNELEGSALESKFILDKLPLTFHWKDRSSDSINNNLLAGVNSKIMSIENTENPSSSQNDIDSIFLVFYVDFYEASLLSDNEYDRRLFANLIRGFNNHGHCLSEWGKSILQYLWFYIPHQVFNKTLTDKLDESIIGRINQLKENEQYLESLEQKNENLRIEVKNLNSELIEQKGTFNFVGLYEGFEKIREQKQNELDKERLSCQAMMNIIVGSIIMKFMFLFVYFISMKTMDTNHLIMISVSITYAVFLFIMLYFFRIFLNNLKSIKSQLLQIDLRLTLCRFIHNYADNTEGLRNDKTKDSFEKFESVIFSPIVSTEDKMPNTFDGLEQLTAMIKEFKR